MLVSYRFLLRPSLSQHRRLNVLSEMQRQLFNAGLEERIGAWHKSGKSISRFDQFKSLTEIRRNDPDGHGACCASMGRWTLKRLDEAMQGFFSRVKKGQKAGFPRFRSYGRWRSFGLLEWKGARISNGFLVIKGMDRALRVNWHRCLPSDAIIKGAVFTKKNGRWVVSLQVETNAIVSEKHTRPGSISGIDVGIESLATCDDGTSFEQVKNVRPRSRRERELRIAQRALARCLKGSSRRKKVKDRLAKVHDRIANHRSTHLHVEAERLARRFETIFVERISSKNMTRSAAGTVAEPGSNVRQKAGLNRSILDAGWGGFIQYMRYKAVRAGGGVLDVDPRHTSQDCSDCGTRVPKSLGTRIHTCPSCGLAVHRDVNAARNIRARGLAALAVGRGVVAPGEPNVAGCGVRAPGTLLAT